jgi:hypothetical protein
MHFRVTMPRLEWGVPLMKILECMMSTTFNT